jgi:hypothetical protein
MSFNRTTYDNCSYKQELQGNVSTLSYLLSPYRYEHENKCRHQLGFVGGTVVSHIQGNLVDLDSELRGQTRIISKCGTNQYVPTEDGIIKNDKTQPIDTTMLHLPARQSIMYREVPMPPKINYDKCQ